MKKLFIVSLAIGALITISCAKPAGVEQGQAGGAAMLMGGGSDYDQAGSLRSVNFDYDKSTLTMIAKEILKQNAAYLKANTNIFVQIEGHCDSRGTIEYNLALGEKRALSVKSYLANLGVPSKKLSTISYGEEKPLASGENDIAWARNRRANFVITSK